MGTQSDRSHPTRAHGLGNIPMDSLRNPRHVNTMIPGLYDVWSYRVNTMISGLYDFDLVALTPWFQDYTTFSFIPLDSLRNPRHVNTMISGLYDVRSYRVNTMISGLYDLDPVALTPWFQDYTTIAPTCAPMCISQMHDISTHAMHIHTPTLWIIPS